MVLDGRILGALQCPSVLAEREETRRHCHRC